ncbi:MAG: T9SS type A sorting domain-containing protein, partial [Saprospiraceae bacterium]|nr:T9SS type A sorting domain-containing protein [Saprospiraceae bacterium]
EIIWPSRDTTVYSCSYENIVTEGPRLKHLDDCREIGIHHKDQIVEVLYNADSICYKVIRTWAIIDWCRQNAPYHADWIDDQNFHYYEFDQIIYVKNQFGPEIFGCDLDTVCIGRYCTGLLETSITVTDDCTPVEEIKISWVLYEKTDFGYLPVDQADSNYVYVDGLQIGAYKLVWKAEDGCHNVTFCTDHFTVKDCVKPTAVCLTSTTLKLLPIDLDQNGLIDTAIGQLWAEELNVSSYDNCFKDIDFLIRLKGTGTLNSDGVLIPPDSTQTFLDFGCSDVGNQEVEMWVVDAAGNADYCVVNVTIQPPVEGCRNELGKVKGIISSMQGAGISGVSMLIEDAGEGRWISETNKEGKYVFETFAMDGSNYRLWPEKTDDPIDGISTKDVIKISKHLLSKEPLKNTLEYMSADANGDGNVSVLDIINIRKLILGKIDALPNEKPWQFFNQEMNPVSEISLALDYKPLTSFTGIKVGDVNGDITNYSRNGRGAKPTHKWHYYDRKFEAGEVLSIPIFSASDLLIEGLQSELVVDDRVLKFVGLQGVNIDITEDHYHLDESRLSLSWFETSGYHMADTLFSIQIQAVQAGTLSDFLSLSGRRINAEIYPVLDDPVDLMLEALYREADVAVGQNFPNPFKKMTTIRVSMPEPAEGLLRIYDLSGRVFIERKEQFLSGINTLEVQAADLNQEGLYFYEITVGSVRHINKMMFTE